MTGLDPGRAPPVVHVRAGYIDHKITLVIVLILAAIAGARYWPLLPGVWSRFLVLTALVVVVGGGVAIAVGAWLEGREPRLEWKDGELAARIPGGALPAAGVLLLALAAHFLVHTWIGSGLLWWVVGALGVAAAGLGATLLGSGERLVVEPGRVALESLLFGRVAGSVECEWELGRSPGVEMSSHTTGGAFGQPLTEVHELKVAGETLCRGTRERVEAVHDVVRGAVARVAVLERLDAEPPWPEGSKARPPGWDDLDGYGVSAALSRRNGFDGLTIFEVETGEVQWDRDPEGAKDLDAPLGTALFERVEPLGKEELESLGDSGVRDVADAFLRSRGFRP